MKNYEVATLPECEKKHFAECPVCGEYVDLRKLEEVVFHMDHETRLNSGFRGILANREQTEAKALELARSRTPEGLRQLRKPKDKSRVFVDTTESVLIRGRGIARKGWGVLFQTSNGWKVELEDRTTIGMRGNKLLSYCSVRK